VLAIMHSIVGFREILANRYCARFAEEKIRFNGRVKTIRIREIGRIGFNFVTGVIENTIN